MIKKANVVIFDFDGTLSASDSNREMVKYYMKHYPMTFLYLPLVGFFGLMRLFNHSGIWWRQGIRCFLRKNKINKIYSGFVKYHKANRFDWAKKLVISEQKAGNIVVLVSASPEYLISGLVDDIPFDAVLTSQTYPDHPWKYKFLCWGPNKVIAFDKWARTNKIHPHVVRSYSDSKSDMPIMNVADEQIWVDNKTGKFIK